MPNRIRKYNTSLETKLLLNRALKEIKNFSKYKALMPRPSREEYKGLEADMLEKPCASCGSTKNVILHHLSYEPEITVPLCKSCRAYAHHSENKAKTYPWDAFFGWGENPKNWNALELRGQIVALKDEKGKLRCWLCCLKGDYDDLFDIEEDFTRQYLAKHTGGNSDA